MIGRLLHLGSGGSAASSDNNGSSPSNAPRPILSLDSVQEDIHTRNLLFPDVQALYQHRNDQVFPLSTAPATPSAGAGSTYDFNDEVDLDVRDVRIVIMQDALGPTNASLLFDSHPLADNDRPTRKEDSKKNMTSPRHGHPSAGPRPVSIQSDSPQPRQGAFDRRTSIHSRTQSYAETETQRTAREYREELATFSSCIFGNSELMAYKGTSTKVHVVPSESRTGESASAVGDGRSSIGRSSMRSSKLSQSFSSQAMSPTFASMPLSTTPSSRHSDRKKVLITRLFPVNLASEDVEPTVTPQNRVSEDPTGFPFPPTSDDAATRKKKPQPKQRRTPMYAVVLVIQLPPATSRMSSAVPGKSTFREPGSYNEQEAYSSSYSSVKAAGWNMSGSGVIGDPSESPFAFDVEDRIDSLTQHWDIIMRTLTHLQSLVATKIHNMLKQADASSPGQQFGSSTNNSVSRAPSVNERRSAEIPRVKPAKGTTKLVSLWPNSLSNDIDVASEVGLARSRIVMGLGASRVVTGQGRWGIWRDEAIWATKWSAGFEKGPFLNNLLTGFLATHTDWLQALCSPSYKRKAVQHGRNKSEEDMALPARTIIVSEDKMAARRLIFLLAAFLPSNQQMNPPRVHRSSTSTSLGPFSNSPPTYVIPVLREESLRRKINRRSGMRRASHSRVSSQPVRNSALASQLGQLNIDQHHQRRASDAASIRTMNLPMPGNDLVSRKSSAATTTTITPEPTMPHFTSLQRGESQLRQRPGSSGSFAADDLKRSLKRGESSTSISTTTSRPPSSGLKWGNLVSGLWPPRRRDSIESTDASVISDVKSPARATFSRPDRLSQMVQESAVLEEVAEPDAQSPRRSSDARGTTTPPARNARGRPSFSQADRTPDPTGAYESPVKTSINPDDGIIDVDVPFPDYIASFESAISSPSSSGYLSNPGLMGSMDLFEQSARITIDGDTPLNAAGWLSRFHPDFAIQAIPSQEGLYDKVKAAMRAEPTPPPLNAKEAAMAERWADVCSVLIADTTTNTVSRIVYRRLVKLKCNNEPTSANQPHTPSIAPYETQLEEEWIEEAVLDWDESLVTALDKVVRLSPEVSKESSEASSQSHGEYGDNAETTPDSLSEITQHADASMDIPRVQCRTMMLSALEETIRDVIDRRDENGEEQLSSHARRRPNLLREAVHHWVSNLDAADLS